MDKTYDKLKGDELIFLEVGRGIHFWSLVEQNMAALFSYLYVPVSLPPENRYAIRAAFDAAIAFQVRLAMLNTAVERGQVSDDVIRSHWPRVSNRLNKKYKQRHEIAHFSIRKDKDKHVLQPFPSFSASLTQKEKAPLKLQDLVQRRTSFMDLADELVDYIQYVRWSQVSTEEGQLEAGRRKEKILAPNV